jgi:putative ABC transport system permease protein
MLLAGAAPIEAVRLQLVLLYVLLGAVALSALLAVLASRRAFFTAEHLLREPAPRPPHPDA